MDFSNLLPNDYCPHCGRGNNPTHNPLNPAPTLPRYEPNLPCSLSQPLGLYIPPGQKMDWPCPVHGSHALYGNGPVC